MTKGIARVFDMAMRRSFGRGRIAPAEYRRSLPMWNEAIATLHGAVFDPSHDRERFRTPSG